MWGREVGVDEKEGIWMRHKGRGPGGPVFLRRGLPSLMELMVSLERELALRTCEWRELAISAAGVFIPELEQGGVLEVEASSRSEL